MNIKLQTNEQLSATVANGLAGVFVNGVSLSASLSGKADLTALQNCYAKSETSSSSEISNELKKYQLSGNYLSSNALDNYYTKTETSSANQISTALANAGGGKVYFDNRISDITGSNDLSVVKLSADEYAQMLDDGTCLSNAIYIVEAPNIDAFKQQIKNVAPPTDLSDAATKKYVDDAIAGGGGGGGSSLSNYYQKTETSSSGQLSNEFKKYQLSGNYLTAVPSTYKTYDQTKSTLSTDGYATTNQVNAKSTVSFNRITTSGTNIASITIDGNTTQIYAPTGGGGGSSVQVSADYSTGTRVATISVDNIPTSIYVPNSSGGSSRYALETAQLIADNGSLTCAVNDQAITTIQVSSSTTPIVVQLPAQPEDGARDFILRIEISSSTAPTFTFNGVSETIDFDSEDDDWAVLEPGLNLVSFTETKRGDGSSPGNGEGGSNIVYHTVTFSIDAYYGSLSNPSDATRQVADGEAVGTLPTIEPRGGYYFNGWYTEQDGTGTQVTLSTIITADVTFYAWCYSGGGAGN